ncbi:PTS glucose transporter subunit IIA [Clostridium baratii]|uniref:PTS sugar transporter subunit IIA n=1 Tax=Clostridium baratii TaxID=1561 RepID=UPI0009A30CBA|nr:PTS glucose transporter subunit IIA [Clostridium baratii]OPF50884.1 PTS glucose transporter subunit IIA [Clostridium baratii]OPF55009.1 PTS glucose transporter subunit IIA [Clostridium baratii]OPF57252.1 PTS glucose transporter subunit IIA [Clostridium baratii]OPF59207.1 PTS glucose transporter subunit IIA [Clostridium baratii]
MFGLFKKNKTEKKDTLNFIAPVDGKTMDLSEVPDPVFAQKMAGDGLAIDATGDVIVAPCDGDLTLVFKTKHAFAMTLDNGIELLVHIGIETVSLNGEGFEQLAEAGTKVKAGTPIIKIDREFIKSKNLPLVTPILITNPDVVKSMDAKTGLDAKAGETVVLEYSL